MNQYLDYDHFKILKWNVARIFSLRLMKGNHENILKIQFNIVAPTKIDKLEKYLFISNLNFENEGKNTYLVEIKSTKDFERFLPMLNEICEMMFKRQKIIASGFKYQEDKENMINMSNVLPLQYNKQNLKDFFNENNI